MNVAYDVASAVAPFLTRPSVKSEEISALCPFHRKSDGSMERTPSFSMSRSTGLWFCHSCKERGNLRHFLHLVGVSYQRIQDEYHLLLDEVAKAVPARLDPLRPNLLTQDPLPEGLLGLFHFVPVLLEQEGFTEQTLARFDVGFDRTHMRITFPLRDLAGRLVGISGRAVNLDPETRRYKLYDTEYVAWGLPARRGAEAERKNVLWNADRLFPALKDVLSPDVFVVEGFKACMWLDQVGVKSTVALLGSYMSEQQQWILERMGARVYLMLDNNEAGQDGTLAIGERLARGLEVLVVSYRPNDEDAQPSDLTPTEIGETIDAAADFFQWKHASGRRAVERRNERRKRG